MNALPETTRPLSGVRVLEISDGLAPVAGLFLAELGAEVVMVEPPGGFTARLTGPTVDGLSLPFVAANAGKLSVTIDLESDDGKQELVTMAETASALLLPTSRTLPPPLHPENLLSHYPSLVVACISAFGTTGPYRDFVRSEAVYMALSGMLARSGKAGREPLLPPRGMVESSVGLQATWTIIVALHKARETGEGEIVDLSIFEAAVQVLDPPFAAVGSARASVEPEKGATGRGRPDMGYRYPTVPCRNGHVRIAILTARQWRGLWRCIGSPEKFADEYYDDLRNRFDAWPEISECVESFFSTRTVDELLELGLRYSFAIGEVLTPWQALDVQHFRDRHAFLDFEMPTGRRAKLASGFLEIDGERWTKKRELAAPGQDNETIKRSLVRSSGHQTTAWRDRSPSNSTLHSSDEVISALPPLSGIRIIDLGVFVVGSETGRLFADLGADVIKVENPAYLDGLRSTSGASMSAGFAWGHRNKRSLGINLRTEAGRDIFKRLVRHADAVVSNFKPGTLRQLGIDYEELSKINPRIVVGESSAYGPTGPWANRMGFGPLVRASTGLAYQWRYGSPEECFADDVTVFPDHTNGRVMASAVLAAITRVRRDGQGCHIESSQAETVFNVLASSYLSESLDPGGDPAGYPGSGGGSDRYFPTVFQCSGDDEWAVIDIQNEDQAEAILRLARSTTDNLQSEVRPADRDGEFDEDTELVRKWARSHTPHELMWICQSVGIPGGAMLRPAELPDDAHLRFREVFTTMLQPGLPPLPSERGPAKFSTIGQPSLTPAPQMGEHTREVLSEWLRIADPEISRLINDGVLHDSGD